MVKGRQKNLTPEQRDAVRAKNEQERKARFARLAPQRVNMAIKRIGHVARLGSRQSYSYTDQQAARIVAALTEAVDAVSRAFAPAADVNGQFTL